MAEKYVVDVAAPAESEAPAVAEQLAGLLKIDVNKVRSLIRRLPDVVTKPITEQEAELVVS